MHSSLKLIIFRSNTWQLSSFCTKLEAVCFVPIQNPSGDYSSVHVNELMEDYSSSHSILTLRSMLWAMEKSEGYWQNRQNINLPSMAIINGASHSNFDFRLAPAHISFLIILFQIGHKVIYCMQAKKKKNELHD